MDHTAKLWDVGDGSQVCTFQGHTAEIVSLSFNYAGDMVITGSFDHDCRIWKVGADECRHVLRGHCAEVSSTQFGYSGGEAGLPARTVALARPSLFALLTPFLRPVPPTPPGKLCASGSIDGTGRIWSTADGRCLGELDGHEDEILDIAFDSSGQRVVTASADCTARIYDTSSCACLQVLQGHTGEISKVAFNSQGTEVITASSDNTCRVWNARGGQCLQVRPRPTHVKPIQKQIRPIGRRLRTNTDRIALVDHCCCLRPFSHRSGLAWAYRRDLQLRV